MYVTYAYAEILRLSCITVNIKCFTPHDFPQSGSEIKLLAIYLLEVFNQIRNLNSYFRNCFEAWDLLTVFVLELLF